MKEKEEVAKAKTACKADKTLATQRRLEERQRQQMILEEMKKPTEDMCLTDHQVVRGEQVLGPGGTNCEDTSMKRRTTQVPDLVDRPPTTCLLTASARLLPHPWSDPAWGDLLGLLDHCGVPAQLRQGARL